MRKWLTYASSSNWLRVVGVGTIIILGCYLMVQQTIRLSANHLPLQTAEIARHQLEAGANPTSVVPATKTNLRTDSTIFVTVVDSHVKVAASSAELDGAPTLPPTSAFLDAFIKGSNWFTWQPTDGVRQAVEILPYKANGQTNYVMAGQSLSSYESLVSRASWIALGMWIGIVLWATFIPIPSRQK